MAKITVTKLFRTDAVGVCGAYARLEFYKKGKKVFESEFSGTVMGSAYTRTVDLPEHDHVMHTVLPGDYGVNFAYSIDEAATWNGEGLPPIGLEVEVFSIAKPHHSYAEHVGQRVRIGAHDVLGEGGDEGTPVAVYAFNLSTGTGYHALIAGHFRPIRTAEQIAAEEREQHRAATMAELNRLWDADTKRSDFLESVYRLMEGKQ